MKTRTKHHCQLGLSLFWPTKKQAKSTLQKAQVNSGELPRANKKTHQRGSRLSELPLILRRETDPQGSCYFSNSPVRPRSKSPGVRGRRSVLRGRRSEALRRFFRYSRGEEGWRWVKVVWFVFWVSFSTYLNINVCFLFLLQLGGLEVLLCKKIPT